MMLTTARVSNKKMSSGKGKGKKRKESKETRRRHKREAENCPTHQAYKERSKVTRVARKDARRIVEAEKKRASAFGGNCWVVNPEKYRWMNESYGEFYSRNLMEAVDDMRMEDERRPPPDLVDLTREMTDLRVSQKTPNREKGSVSGAEDPDVDWMMKHDIEGGFDWSEGWGASPDDHKVPVPVPDEWGVVTADEVLSYDLFEAKKSAPDVGVVQGFGGAFFPSFQKSEGGPPPSMSSEAEVGRIIATSPVKSTAFNMQIPMGGGGADPTEDVGGELEVGEESLNKVVEAAAPIDRDAPMRGVSGVMEKLGAANPVESTPPDAAAPIDHDTPMKDMEEVMEVIGVSGETSKKANSPALVGEAVGDFGREVTGGIAALSSESSPPDDKEGGVGVEGGVGGAPSQSSNNPALLDAPIEDDPAVSDAQTNEVAEVERAFRDGGADLNGGFTLPSELHACWVQKDDLSDDELVLVKKHFQTRGRADKILIQGMGDMGGYNVIQLGSFKRLQSPKWLNDEVINYWYKLLQERDVNLCNANPGRKASLFFNTQFITTLFDMGNKNVSLRGRYLFRNAIKRWVNKAARKVTQGGDLLNLKRIFFPVHLGIHWVSAVIDMEQKAIMWYDSMGSTDTYKLKGLLRLLCDVCKDSTGNSRIVETEWSLVPCNTEEVPEQLNGYDCGVFTCMFANYISLDLGLEFSQRDMNLFRDRIALQIIKSNEM